MSTLIRNRKIQRGQNVDALADAEKSREEGQCADGVIYRLDHVAKTNITTIPVICVGCHIAIKMEKTQMEKTYHLVDGFAIGLKKEIETQQLEDLTTLPREHLQIRNQIGMKIMTTTTHVILNHQSISQSTRRITTSIA